MEQAKELVEKCIRDNSTSLNISTLQLMKLPDNLPDNLEKLYCGHNKLTELPNNLPRNLKLLNCNGNNLMTKTSCTKNAGNFWDYLDKY